MLELFINGKPLSDFGALIFDSGYLQFPERDIQKIEVAGISGDLAISSGRYKNVKLKYEVFFTDNFFQRFSAVLEYLHNQEGYMKLEDSYFPDEYREVMYYSSTEGKYLNDNLGRFELIFDAKPQRYLKSGDDPIFLYNGDYQGSGRGHKIVWNPTENPAYPLLDFQTNETYGTLFVSPTNYYYGSYNKNKMRRVQTDYYYKTEGASSANVDFAHQYAPVGMLDCELIYPYNTYDPDTGYDLTLNPAAWLTREDKKFRLEAGYNRITIDGLYHKGEQYWERNENACVIMYPRWWRL